MSTSQLNMSRTSRTSRMSKKGMRQGFNTSMASINPNTTRESFNMEVKSFMSKRRISKTAWFAFIFLGVANLLNLVTSVAPGWAWTHEINGEFKTAGEYYGLYGIWYICWDSIDGKGWRECELLKRLDLFEPNAFWKTVQALSVLTMVCGMICFVTLGAYMCVPMFNNSFMVLRGYIAIASISVVLNFSLFTVYGTTMLYRGYWCCDPSVIQRELIDFGLSYCFGLSCVAAAAFICTAVAGGCEMTKMKREIRLARKMRRTGLRHYDPEEQMIIDPQAFMAYNQMMYK